MAIATKTQGHSKIIHLSDKLQTDLTKVLEELFYFSINNYDDIIMERTYDTFSKIKISAELKERIFSQLVWWVTFCCPVSADEKSIFQLFLKLNRVKWKNKSTAFHKILASWQLSSPGFYITQEVGESKRVYKLIDIFRLKPHIVGVYNEIYQPSQHGEMLTGILLPLGDGTYTTPVDFFHIPISRTPKVAWKLMLQYKKHAVSSNYCLNPQNYPSLISSALELIENNH